MKMKSEIGTMRESRKGRLMRTGKKMHAKITIKKVTKCYSGRRNTVSCHAIPFKQVSFTVVQKNGNSVLVETKIFWFCQTS